MIINFKRSHPKAVPPRKAHKSDYAFDCVAVTEEEVAPNVWKYGLGFAVQIDEEDRWANQCPQELDELKVMDRGANGYGSTGLKGM